MSQTSPPPSAQPRQHESLLGVQTIARRCYWLVGVVDPGTAGDSPSAIERFRAEAHASALKVFEADKNGSPCYKAARLSRPGGEGSITITLRYYNAVGCGLARELEEAGSFEGRAVLKPGTPAFDSLAAAGPMAPATLAGVYLYIYQRRRSAYGGPAAADLAQMVAAPAPWADLASLPRWADSGPPPAAPEWWCAYRTGAARDALRLAGATSAAAGEEQHWREALAAALAAETARKRAALAAARSEIAALQHKHAQLYCAGRGAAEVHTKLYGPLEASPAPAGATAAARTAAALDDYVRRGVGSSDELTVAGMIGVYEAKAEAGELTYLDTLRLGSLRNPDGESAEDVELAMRISAETSRRAAVSSAYSADYVYVRDQGLEPATERLEPRLEARLERHLERRRA